MKTIFTFTFLVIFGTHAAWAEFHHDWWQPVYNVSKWECLYNHLSPAMITRDPNNIVDEGDKVTAYGWDGSYVFYRSEAGCWQYIREWTRKHYPTKEDLNAQKRALDPYR